MEGIADYVFLRRLGGGPHGQVHLASRPARLTAGDDQVAVKVLAGNATTDAFYRMARHLGFFEGLHSDRLVPLYDAGLDNGAMYYAMRYHPQGSLATPTQELSRRQRLTAVSRAARGAHELHEAGTVHRAIKPANVLLDDAGGCLSDIGTAQLVKPGLTVTGLGPHSGIGAHGELEYIDPWLLRGRHVGRTSDIWSLGVTLHVCLTGHGLYPALPSADPLVAVRLHVKSTPELDPDLAADERAVIARALQPERSQRYLTAADLADDIDKLASAW
jgi:serine/threonine-protein kinase